MIILQAVLEQELLFVGSLVESAETEFYLI